MRARPRLIPCLLVQDGRLVKTRRFAKPTYVGDPLNAVRIFNDKGADELMVLDISRSRAKRGPDFDLVRRIAAECFMPLAYGGGVTTIEQAQQLVSLGVEKVCINTAWVNDASLLPGVAEAIGSQSAVAAIDAVRRNGDYSAAVRNGRPIASSPVELARRAVAQGAGEILIQSVDRDGTMTGYDLDLIRQVTAAVQVPVTAAGGARDAADLAAAIHVGGASAAAAGALFVFKGPHRAVLISMPAGMELAPFYRSEAAT